MSTQNAERLLRETLREYATREVPYDLDLWAALRTRSGMAVNPSRRKLQIPMPATRLGWAVVATIVFLALSTATYSMAPILSRAFQMEAGTEHIEESNLGTEVDLSQTINGQTVTVKRVYADANRIVVGFTIASAKDTPGVARIEASEMKLTDERGTLFPGGVETGSGVEAGTAGYVASFDASALRDAPSALKLHLVTNLTALYLPDAPAPTPVRSRDGSTTSVQAMPVRTEVVAGPFNFSFSVPFIPGRVAEVQQTVEASGVAVTLERLVVTPSETRVFLRYDAPNGESELEWLSIVALEINGQARGTDTIQGPRQLEDGRWIYRLHAALYDEQREWTVKVNELVGMDPLPMIKPGESIGQKRLGGPWVFNIEVPPAPTPAP